MEALVLTGAFNKEGDFSGLCETSRRIIDSSNLHVARPQQLSWQQTLLALPQQLVWQHTCWHLALVVVVSETIIMVVYVVILAETCS